MVLYAIKKMMSPNAIDFEANPDMSSTRDTEPESMGPRSIDLEVDRTLRLQAVNLTAHQSRVSSTAEHYLVSRAKDVTRIVLSLCLS